MNVAEKLAAYMPALVNSLRNGTPIKTGNLRYNAVKYESASYGEWRIFVDVEIAPYMPYTNEPWTSPKWHGLKNPNEGWWQRETERILTELAGYMDGEKRIK